MNNITSSSSPNNWSIVWIDKDRLKWQRDSSFSDTLKWALGSSKKIKLTNKRSKKKDEYFWVYSTNIPKTKKCFENMIENHQNFAKNEKIFQERKEEIRKNFAISKSENKKSWSKVRKFLNETLLPLLKEAEDNSDSNKLKKYEKNKNLIWSLNKRDLQDWEIITAVVERWNEKTKQYRALIWKQWEAEAWAYFDDLEENTLLDSWDIIYFIAKETKPGKISLKEFSPKKWELTEWSIISIRNLQDDWKTDYLHLRLWNYSGIIKRELLPEDYKLGDKLELKITKITEKNWNLLLKFDKKND